MARLVLPSEKYRTTYCETKRANTAVQNADWNTFQVEQFDEYVAYIRKLALGKDIGKATPQSRYWLIDGEKFIGEIHIRHRPSGQVIPSHIYYEIAPQYRGQGYGKLILKLGLRKVKKLRLHTVTIVCHKENVASRRIIESNGGVLREEIDSQYVFAVFV